MCRGRVPSSVTVAPVLDDAETGVELWIRGWSVLAGAGELVGRGSGTSVVLRVGWGRCHLAILV